MRSLCFVGVVITVAAAPAAAQTRITQSGPVPHAAASAVLPERVGEFRRTSVVRLSNSSSAPDLGRAALPPATRLPGRAATMPADS